MTRAESGAPCAGFSLLEATAAIALTTTIVLALSSITDQWFPNWRRGLVDLQRADLLNAGVERMAEDVSAAEYVTPSAGAQAPLFAGDSSTMEFVRSAIGPNSYPHLEIVRLAQTMDDRGLALTRTRAPFAPGKPTKPFSFGDAVALVRAPYHVLFAYAGKDRVWVGSWKGRKRLPDAVRITIRDSNDRMLAASTAIRIKVTAPGAPDQQGNAANPPAGAPASPAPNAQGPAAMATPQ